MTAALPRHSHAERADRRAAETDDIPRPAHTGPILGGAAGVLILVVLTVILTGEALKMYDLPSVVAMVLTAAGVGGLIIAAQTWMNIDSFWHTGKVERKVDRAHEEIGGELTTARKELAAMRAELADYRVQRMAMVADARKDMAALTQEIADMRTQAAFDREERVAAIAAACDVFSSAREEMAGLRKILPEALAQEKWQGYGNGYKDAGGKSGGDSVVRSIGRPLPQQAPHT